MCPFSIDKVDRELVGSSNGHESYLWHIPINWPQVHLQFLAHGFLQTALGEAFRNDVNATK